MALDCKDSNLKSDMYKYKLYFFLKDVDECVEIPDVCGPNSICNNTVGSHNCSCMSGYNVTDPNIPINSNNTCEGMNDS